MTDQHDDDGLPVSGGPSSSDPYAPPPRDWRPPTAPVGGAPPPPDPGGPPLPPPRWAPQPPPYAAPPDWRPPPPPTMTGAAGYGPAGYGPPPPAAGSWQPTAAATWQPAPGYGRPGGWPPAPAPSGSQLPYGWAPAYGGNGKTNGFCIASLVLAVPPVCVFTLGVGSLLGVVFGIVGLRQTRRDGTGGRGMGIAGIILGVLGLLVVALVVIGFVIDSSAGSNDSGNGSATTISTMSQPPGSPTQPSIASRSAR